MSKKKFGKETVEYTARLARMSLSEGELRTLSGQLDDILGYIEKLNKVNTEKVAPTSHVLPIRNVFRKDKIKPSLDPAQALKNAPEKQGKFFVVPKIIE